VSPLRLSRGRNGGQKRKATPLNCLAIIIPGLPIQKGLKKKGCKEDILLGGVMTKSEGLAGPEKGLEKQRLEARGGRGK